MIAVTETLLLDENDIQIDYVQASGPGGQNVNKVATQVQLRFDTHSASLPEEVRQRLVKIAGNRITEGGILIIEAKRYRSQERNRQDAENRLVALIRRAAVEPKKRQKTQPTLASRQKRLDAKRRRGEIKKLRRRIEEQ